jgi:hypothetical protein
MTGQNGPANNQTKFIQDNITLPQKGNQKWGRSQGRAPLHE